MSPKADAMGNQSGQLNARFTPLFVLGIIRILRNPRNRGPVPCANLDFLMFLICYGYYEDWRRRAPASKLA